MSNNPCTLQQMLSNYFPIIIILTIAAFITEKAKKLTFAASVTGWVVGLLIFAGAGYAGVTMIGTFFLLGTAATSFKIKTKQKLGVAEKDKGRRNAAQVVANAGVAAILGILIVCYPEKANLFRVMIGASVASATADTLSSELGNLFGKNYYNIITLQKDKRGLDGVVSAEGTLSGIAGSTIITSIYAIAFGFDVNFFWIIIAGTIGNLSDSVLGATLERQGFLGNNQVNFLNTAFAALFVFVIYIF